MASETVTLLFCDVVKSTELLVREGEERAEEIRRELFEILRSVISADDGREVKNLGDGLMVVFGGVIGAVGCAVEMQQSLHRRNRRAETQLSIRVGVSSGEVDVADDDYFGVPVVEAARLCAVADPDQILITDIVRLLAGSRGDFELVALGTRELKGLDVPVVVHEVRWTPAASDTAVPLPARLQRAEGSVFVGRVRQQALLDEALKHTDVARQRQVVLCSGEAGIGKTTLVSTFAAVAHAEGAIVLYGRCDEDLTVPYEPWAEALTHLVNHAPEETLRAHVAERGGDILALVPALVRRLPDVPQCAASDPETERHLMFGSVVDLLTRASADAPIVLVLDDLHWADRTTLQLLRHVVLAAAPLRLLVLGTFRETDLGASHPLTELLAALHREDGVQRLPLDGLDDLELLALMEAAAGHELDAAGIALRDQLLEETNGNPFFAVEILRHLAETGPISQVEAGQWVADLGGAGLPVSVREVVGRRVERLGDDATHVLSTAAVIGRDFDLPLLARSVELDEDRVVDVLDEAVHAFVISEVPGSGERYTFVHALIQRTLYDDLSAARRRRLHRRIAEALETLPAERTERVVELARHWFEATQPEDAPKAFRYAVAAGEDAQARLAPDEAVRWFTQALELVDQVPVVGARGETLIKLGVAQRLAGMAVSRGTLLDAARMAERDGDTDRLVAAALANTRGFSSNAGEVDDDKIRVLHAALSAVGGGSPAARARLLALLAVESFYAPGVDVDALLDEALDLSASAGDPVARLVVVRSFQIWFVPHTLARRRALLDEAVGLADSADPARRTWTMSERTQLDFQVGDAAVLREHHADFKRAAAKIADPAIIWSGMFADAMLAMQWSDPAEAERLAEDALRFGTETGQLDAFPVYAGQLSWLRRMQGRAAEICDLVAEVAQARPGIPAFRATLAATSAEAGRIDDARRLLDDFCATGLTTLRVDIIWGTMIVGLAQAASLVEHRELAAQVVPLIDAFRDQMAFSGCTIDGPFSLALGSAYRLLGQFGEAEIALQESLDLSRRLESLYFEAVTKIEWAMMVLDRGADGDRAEADALLAGAIECARERGYPAVEARAEALLAP